MLKYDGFCVTDIVPILKYICKKHNRQDLLGKNIADQCLIEELLSKFTPHRNRIVEKVYSCLKVCKKERG